MNVKNACLGCGEPFDWSEIECPECGWDKDEWAANGRHGLGKEGHGEPEDDGGSGGGGLGGRGSIR